MNIGEYISLEVININNNDVKQMASAITRN